MLWASSAGGGLAESSSSGQLVKMLYPSGGLFLFCPEDVVFDRGLLAGVLATDFLGDVVDRTHLAPYSSLLCFFC